MPNVDVFFATNRRPNRPADPTEFTDEIVGDVDSIRFGVAGFRNVDLSPKADAEKLGDKATIVVARERLDPSDATASHLGSKEVFAAIRKAMVSDKSDALFYLHGYDHTFRESMARAAQLRHWLSKGQDGKPLVMLAFAWPSLGRGVSPQTYKDERRRAEASGFAIGRAILKAADFLRAIPKTERCEQRVHLMAHSMGNWALRGAVQAMRTFVGDNIPPLFDEALLMAADEDDDTLSKGHKIQPLLRGCRRVSVYYNRLDVALKGSDVAMGNPDRLGRSGPEDRALIREKVVPISVASVIDQDEDPTQHQYYRNNRIVRKDVLAVLRGQDDDEIAGRSFAADRYLLTGGR